MNYRAILYGALGLAFGAIFLGGSQAAIAVGWEEGACENNHTNSGPAPCFDYLDSSTGLWWHFNGDGEGPHVGEWHGRYPTGTPQPLPDPAPPQEDFVFCGETVLSCTSPLPLAVSCELCLTGQVRKCYDDDAETWRVGIKITGGSVNPGDGLCTLLDVTNFPWYAGPDDYHGPYNEDCGVGIPYPGPLVGSVGLVNVTTPLFNINDSHIHNVTYNNIDSFIFNGELVVGYPHTGSTCVVNGILQLQPEDDELHVH